MTYSLVHPSTKDENLSKEGLNLKYGPIYPDLGRTVAKFRRKAKDGLKHLSVFEREAYGDAVSERIRALQKNELASVLAVRTFRSNSASGTFANSGEAVHAAVREQQRKELDAYPSYIRRNRDPQKVREEYEAVIAEKRARLEAEKVEPSPQLELAA
jgi:hypothetical protein